MLNFCRGFFKHTPKVAQTIDFSRAQEFLTRHESAVIYRKLVYFSVKSM